MRTSNVNCEARRNVTVVQLKLEWNMNNSGEQTRYHINHKSSQLC
jgi:hypothetical protein